MERSLLKCQRLRALATPDGIIAAVAMDQRKSLRQMIAKAAGLDSGAVPDSQLAEFKAEVARVLTGNGTSAILLDPEYGLEAAPLRNPGCGLLMTYEADGFENPRPHRMLELLPHMSVGRLRTAGAGAVKILLSWAPDDDDAANDCKRALIERIGGECKGLDMPFFLEPVVYDPAGTDPRSFEFARQKPALVLRTIEEFSKPYYQVDILKIEFPVHAAFVEGSSVYCGRRAHSMEEALDHFRAADSAARLPYIFLSAGITILEFTESLRLAADAGARFSGVLCGRANWQGGVASYVRGGPDAFREWLESDGLKNVRRVNDCLRRATSWERV